MSRERDAPAGVKVRVEDVAEQAAKKVESVTSAAKAATENKVFIAALKRCATQNCATQSCATQNRTAEREVIESDPGGGRRSCSQHIRRP